MGIFLIIMGILILLIFIEWIEGVVSKFKKTINWTSFFGTLIFGAVVLTIIFSFTSESIVVVIFAFIFLIIWSLIKGLFRDKI